MQYLVRILLLILVSNTSGAFVNATELSETDIVSLRNVVHFTHATIHPTEAPTRGGQVQVGEQTFTIYPFSDERNFFMGAVFKGEQGPLIIGFRGSQQVADWLYNLDAAPLAAEKWHPDMRGRIHSGFAGLADSLYDNLLRSVLSSLGGEDIGEKNLFFTGYSLGGALSYLTGIKMFTQKNLRMNQVNIINFASPCVGDDAFSSDVGIRLGGNILNFICPCDLVPCASGCLYKGTGLLIKFSGFSQLQGVSLADEELENLLTSIATLAGKPTLLSGWAGALRSLLGVSKKIFETFHRLPTPSNLRESFLRFKERGEADSLSCF